MGHVIWVEGIIGAGKTTAAKAIAEALNYRPIYEPVGANFLLEDFYRDPHKYAFAMQISLLAIRYNLQLAAATEAIGHIGYDGAVLDRGLPGDKVFAGVHLKYGNIDPQRMRVYEQHFEIMSASLRPPSLLVYLDVSPKVALDRVLGRDRGCEDGLPLQYLIDLHDGYEEMLEDVESGRHAWSRGISVLRIPWDVPHSPISNVIEQIKQTLHIGDKI